MYTGLNAKLTVNGNTVAYISNWSVEETRDIIEITQLGVSSKEKIPSLKSWSASADGAADFTTAGGQKELRAAMAAGAKILVKFYLNETTYLMGAAYIESLSLDISAEDKANISISLSGDGELHLAAPPYDLNISGTNCSVTVKVHGLPILQGAGEIAYGQVLTITATPAEGYIMQTLIVNGAAFISGQTHSVIGNVSITAAAATA